MTDHEYANQCIQRLITDNLDHDATIKKNNFYIHQWNEVALGLRQAESVVLHIDDGRMWSVPPRCMTLVKGR